MMISHNHKSLSYDVSAFYINAKYDVGFEELARRFEVTSDESTADLIECDARYRLDHGKVVFLDRYLRAIKDLPQKPVSFDAAIEFALRSIQESGLSIDEAVVRLVGRYPAHAGAIYKSAAMGELLPSTNSTRRYLLGNDELELPLQMGPRSPRNGFRYDLRQVIGFGAHGVVYLAVDRELSSPSHPAFVAIKMLGKHIRELVGEKRFDEEAMRTRRVTHPNVVHVLDQGNHDGRQYFVYEYIGGGDLAGTLKQAGGILDPRQASRLMAKVCHGVQAVHAAAIVHMDLKPTNIMMSCDMEPKIADFGVARCLWENRTRLKREADEDPVGTVVYMSPECYLGEEAAVTTMADVYSLGVVLIELLTGKRPAGRVRGSMQAHYEQKHALSLQEIIDSSPASVDSDLRAICRRAISQKSHERFTSAEAMARSLEDWLDRRPLEWRRPPVTRRVVLLVRRRTAVCALSLVLVLATIGAVAAILHISAMARENVLKEKVAIQDNAIRQVQTALQSLHIALNGRREGLEMQWVPTLMMLEQLSEPFEHELSSPLEDFSDVRVQAVQSLVSGASDYGFESDTDVLMWETLLGYWLILGGEPGNALDVLQQNEAEWTMKLTPGDSWLEIVKDLKACALIELSMRPPSEGSDDRVSPVTIEEARRQLFNNLEIYQGHRENSGIHKLVIEAIAKATQ